MYFASLCSSFTYLPACLPAYRLTCCRCVIDRKPRVFDAESCMMLTNMGQMVVRELEKDAALAAQTQMSAALSAERKQLMKAMNAFS
jgi:hypothetical protein